jgi:hypothetical protein
LHGKSKWAISAIRGKEGEALSPRTGGGRYRWPIARKGKRRKLGLWDSLFRSLGESTLKTGEEGYSQLALDVLEEIFNLDVKCSLILTIGRC